MVGVANIAAHRQAQELAAEMVLQPGAYDLLAVEQIFRADESNHRIDQQRIKGARHRVGSRFQRLLVDPLMRLGRKRASLTRLEIHDLVADSATPGRQPRTSSLAEQGKIDAEMAICRFCSGDGLKYQIDRRAPRSMAASAVVTCAST